MHKDFKRFTWQIKLGLRLSEEVDPSQARKGMKIYPEGNIQAARVSPGFLLSRSENLG